MEHRKDLTIRDEEPPNRRDGDVSSLMITAPAPLGPGAALFRVFRTVGCSPLGGKKGISLALLMLLPIVLMTAGRILGAGRSGGSLFFIQTLVPFYHAVNLVAYIFLASAALSESVEDRGILYDLTSPLRRWTLFAGRFAAYLASAWLLVLPALMIAFIIAMAPYGMDALYRALPTALSVTALTAAATVIYGSLFFFLGLLIKRSVLFAIVYAAAVDGFLAYLPFSPSALSPQVHLRNLMAALSGENRLLKIGTNEVDLATTESLAFLSVMLLILMGASIYVFGRKQLP